MGLSAGWKLVFFLLETLELHLFPAGGNKSQEGPLPGTICSQAALAQLC